MCIRDSFWVQSILGVVVAAVLLFSNVVNNSEGQLGLAPGLSLTTISLILLLFSLWQGWLIVRTGRAIASLKSSKIRDMVVSDRPGAKPSCPSLLFTTFEKSKTAATTTPKMD